MLKIPDVENCGLTRESEKGIGDAFHVLRGEIAQLVEQGTENPRVIGSIPILATIFLLVQTLLGFKFHGSYFCPMRDGAKLPKYGIKQSSATQKRGTEIGGTERGFL